MYKEKSIINSLIITLFFIVIFVISFSSISFASEKLKVSVSPNGDVTWDVVADADYYAIGIGSSISTSTNTNSINLNDIIASRGLDSGSYTIDIGAISVQGNLCVYITDKWTTTWNYQSKGKLKKPINIRWYGKTARWEKVENADEYKVYFYTDKNSQWYSTFTTVQTPYYDCSANSFFDENKECAFEVQALSHSGYSNSDPSEKSTFDFGLLSLGSLNNVNISKDGVLSWDHYPGTAYYEYSLGDFSGKTINNYLPLSDIATALNFAELNNYSINLTAFDSEGFTLTNSWTGVYNHKTIKDLSKIDNLTITGVSNCYYTGNPITLKLTVICQGASLSEGKDYIVEYQNNIDPGTALLKVIGIGNYSGEIIKSFKILQSPQTTEDNNGSKTNDTNTNNSSVLGRGSSEIIVDKAIKESKSEEGPDGSSFIPLKFRMVKSAKSYIKCKWTKPSGTKKIVLYGNICGSKYQMKKIATLSGNSYTLKKINGKKLKKGTYYKIMIVAYDTNNTVLSASKVIHIATLGGKVGNWKAIKTKIKNNKATIKVKKSKKIVAKLIPASTKATVKKHRSITYESSNPAIASVSKKGIIKGIKKGTCEVYAYAQNGVFVKIKVKVK